MPTIVPISFRESSKNVAVNFRRIIQKKGPNSPGNEFRNNSEHYYFVLRSVQLRASIEDYSTISQGLRCPMYSRRNLLNPSL